MNKKKITFLIFGLAWGLLELVYTDPPLAVAQASNVGCPARAFCVMLPLVLMDPGDSTLEPTSQAVPTSTLTPSSTPSPTSSLTGTPPPSLTSTVTHTLTPSSTPSPPPTATPTPSPTLSPAPTETQTPTPSDTPSPVLMETETSTPSDMPTPTPTATETDTPTPTFTPSPTSTPTPTGSEADTVVIAAAGDVACGTGSRGAACKHMETSDLLLAINPEQVLALGDLQYEDGSLSDYLAFYDPAWGRLKSETRPAAGNHEYVTDDAAGYFSYFGAAAGDPEFGYYSYDVGQWHLIALNSNCSRVGGCGKGDPQHTWLKNDLNANPTDCTLAYMHHPLWASSSLWASNVRPLVQVLYDSGVELLLVGHAHNYERFAPQDANGNLDALYGIREIVVGTGGRNFTSFGTIKPNSEVRDRSSFGVLKLTLAPTQYTWEFVPIAGSSWTDGPLTESCHGPHP